MTEAQIDPALIPHATQQQMTAMYATAAGCGLKEAWELYGQHTWKEAFGAAYPDGKNISIKAGTQAVRDDLEYWEDA